MENIDPIVEMDPEPGTRSPRMAKDKVKFTLDTHAMAYKLLLSDSGLEDREETSSEMVSEYGKEARMDFYKNRSRSDGASAIMKSCLEELRQRKATDEDGPDGESDDDREAPPPPEPSRRRSSFANTSRRNRSEPSDLASGSTGTSEPLEIMEPSKLHHVRDPWSHSNDRGPAILGLEMPQRAPLTYIPAVDSSEQLLTYERSSTSNTDRRRLFSQNRFVPYFTLPSPSFILHCLLDERKICLESFDSTNTQLAGLILVKRAPVPGVDDARRKVYARWTMDEWRSHHDADASFYEPCGQRANVDRFRVRLSLEPGQVGAGMRLEFALALEIECSDGRQVAYWDNNNQTNYAFWYSG